ncbi:hypothetical protein Fleli_2195 [Bernardetia litoralis DSM 6794]|uniref:Periplasmic heavy metal sensor n=1 Tax=Bernardetia litoralis (strain ATCC 23117 / DSM 6794 / NBRC 15988 / NCIMB 1366 / Fx l1 / Sio-4) TaxID=880071 RepID=I4AKT9_BERLS|nr:hypothetical protein [Bernardetia litoralis]AFM04574.1 hypothetical protein Fleli_2195 [Bernardetia litoralis DSM 6794]
MKTLQFYKISTLVLLVLNLVMMGFFFLNFHRPPHGAHQENDFLNEAIEVLQLDEKQATSFEKLAMNHNQEMESIRNKQLEHTEEYFETNNDTNKSDSLLNLISEGETQKIKITKNHFNQIRNILTSKQQHNYQKFKREALNKILLQRQPNQRR